MPRYKYDNTHVWLYEFLNRTDDIESVRQFARELAQGLTSDDIQSIFQHEMMADGYFEDLGESIDDSKDDAV